MGKHGRKSVEYSQSTLKKIPKSVLSKLNPLVRKLLEKCTNVDNSPGKQFEDYKEISNLLEQIRRLEKDYVVSLPIRNDNTWIQFFQWCKENGAKVEGVAVEDFGSRNFGVVAEKDLKENDLYFVIPKKIMITEESAENSKLSPLIKESPIIKHMPNVKLAVFLIMEFLNETSFWKPYLSILPNSFNTILYFNVEEMELLQKCNIFDEAVNFYRSIARQYAYFHQLFQHNAIAQGLHIIGDYFTYDLYRWAVSVIMTRQNFLPVPESDSLTAALIPLWDMCNHANGKHSTDFNVEKSCLEAYAMKDYKKGEEVFMFYGKRSNSMLFLHNGFVYSSNDYDSLVLKLGLSKSDLLFAQKNNLCKENDIILTGSFEISKNNILEERLLTFLKINVLKEDEIHEALKNNSLLYGDSLKCKEITSRAFTYLKDRVTLLLNCFKTSVEEDKELLLSLDNSRKRLVIELLISEKEMLQYVIKHCLEKISPP